ncbi:hypothetical protein GF359_02640 [candidate division WOR-3 bacterium]|uniref:Tetratricopeptide repeat protein n=1 Tax=candidate division WOR-3 bacterium TaxID=2052148 RepID=A0A9D5QCI7_UNCW3|nr:hypothetical protein [candidate division WOR-3 bacterium]MBD3364092.1 hypothetical protein [candidate division WOR-3 bacterium]
MANEFAGKIFELIKQGKRKEAERLVKQAIAIEPETAGDYLKRGIGYSYSGGMEATLADYQKAVEFDPDNIDARLRLGGMLLMLKQHRKVLEEYEEIIRLEPDNPQGHRFKVTALVELEGD